MSDNYSKIAKENLKKLYADLPEDLAQNLPGIQEGKRFVFNAFGEECIVSPEGITLGNHAHSSVFDILISLYALNARADVCILNPFKAFKEFADTAPYVGAFASHTEKVLVPHVDRIEKAAQAIIQKLGKEATPRETGGDFSFTLYPLPKIALCYIFYRADDDFPASVTCLYSNNAQLFLPVDGLADVGEYCSKKILALIE